MTEAANLDDADLTDILRSRRRAARVAVPEMVANQNILSICFYQPTYLLTPDETSVGPFFAPPSIEVTFLMLLDLQGAKGKGGGVTTTS